MVEKHRITKQQEAELPNFNNRDEAVCYFEQKYGEKFIFEESVETIEGSCFFYRLIIDEEAYIKGATDLNSNGTIGIEFKRSYQPIQIKEDGSIYIDH